MSYGELIIIIFLSIVVHFGLSLLLPELIGKVFGRQKT